MESQLTDGEELLVQHSEHHHHQSHDNDKDHGDEKENLQRWRYKNKTKKKETEHKSARIMFKDTDGTGSPFVCFP